MRSTGSIECNERESPGKNETDRYTFGNIFTPGFSLKEIVHSQRLASYRREFAYCYGAYVCNPEVCDVYKNDLCQGGCATHSAYSKIDPATGLVVKNTNPHNYSEHREDPLCPAWTVLAERVALHIAEVFSLFISFLNYSQKGTAPSEAFRKESHERSDSTSIPPVH